MLPPRVISVIPILDYKIVLAFEDGENRVMDVSPYIGGDWFGKLKDRSCFSTVRVVGRTVEWDDG